MITDSRAKTILLDELKDNFHDARVCMTLAMIGVVNPCLNRNVKDSIKESVLVTVPALSPSQRLSIAHCDDFIHHFKVSRDDLSVLLLDFVLRRT